MTVVGGAGSGAADWLLTGDSPVARVQRSAGNKGRYLHELTRLGANVPPFCVIAVEAFQEHCARSGLAGRIARRLEALAPGDAGAAAVEIRALITGAPATDRLVAAVREALGRLGPRPIAVRSSGQEEDSAKFSFAGQFDSFLGVSGEAAVVDAVKACWASAYTERALVYRQRNRLGNDVGIAVVLQRLVAADVSGVTFTVNPTTGNPYEMVISAVYGLGEGLVSGAVDADVVNVDKHGGAVRCSVVGGKQQRHDAAGVSDVPRELQQASCLSEAQVDELRRQALAVEKALGRPQDIEWCYADGQLWLLQARPITGVGRLDPNHFELWDNSNIVENYPGITSPLTFSLARHLYGRVFAAYCRSLLIPRAHLQEMEGFLGSLLGYLNGRVYYNLLHWYRLVGVNPLQKLGRQMLEVQMGLGESLDLAQVAERIAPYHPASRLEGAAIRLVSSARFLWMFARSEALIARFTERFRALCQRHEGSNLQERTEERTPEELFVIARELEREVIDLWAVTISLESAIGLPYGILRLLARRWLPGAPGWFEVAVIGGVDDMASVQPARDMEQLAALVNGDDGLAALVRETPSRELDAALRARGATALLARVDAYVADFGFRAHNELKLEEPDMRQDRGVFYDMLKVALAGAGRPPAAAHDHTRETEALLARELNPLQRLVFGRVRDMVRGAIRRRETVRLCRSRMFALFRRLYRAMGEGLAAQGALEQADDVFQLRREELAGLFDGGMPHRDSKALVNERKRDAARFRAMPELPPRFVSRGPVGVWLSWFEAGGTGGGAAPPAQASGELRGTACSPGVVEGTAKVVKEPTEFDGGILVTYRTDPGWITIFPAAKALLVERGSPLTHAAIVARELGLPTIVQIPGLTSRVKHGMELRVDAGRGHIAVVSPEPIVSER